MSDRSSAYDATCKPSEYSEEELTYILANCGPTDEQMGCVEDD